MKIQCLGVLFDLDGVLVDSTPAVARVWTKWAVNHGFEPEQVVRQAHGRPSITTIRELLPTADHRAEDREVERCEIEDVGDVVALPGALQLLRALPLERWAIVTSCTCALADVRIRAAGLRVPRHMITATDIERGKPDPEPYLKGALRLGVPAADCVVVEDAPAGIRSGKAAGARVLAVRTTADDAELVAAGADWITRGLGSVGMESSDGTGRLVLELGD